MDVHELRQLEHDRKVVKTWRQLNVTPCSGGFLRLFWLNATRYANWGHVP